MPPARDDFGLAGLGRAIEATRTLSLSNTKTPPSLYLSSVLSMEDLGLPHHVRQIRVSFKYLILNATEPHLKIVRLGLTNITLCYCCMAVSMGYMQVVRPSNMHQNKKLCLPNLAVELSSLV